MDVTKFEELQLDDRIIRAITEMGFEEASPIQAQAIPVVLEGRDMIGQAQTGTGKQLLSVFLCCRRLTRR